MNNCAPQGSLFGSLPNCKFVARNMYSGLRFAQSLLQMRFILKLQCEFGVENQKKILEIQTNLNRQVSHEKKFEKNLHLVIICCLRASFLTLIAENKPTKVKCQQNFVMKTKQQSKIMSQCDLADTHSATLHFFARKLHYTVCSTRNLNFFSQIHLNCVCLT